jgi:hypothetical protein
VLDLNEIRQIMASFMQDHPRGSLDSALFYAMKHVYKEGYEHGRVAVLSEVQERERISP